MLERDAILPELRDAVARRASAGLSSSHRTRLRRSRAFVAAILPMMPCRGRWSELTLSLYPEPYPCDTAPHAYARVEVARQKCCDPQRPQALKACPWCVQSPQQNSS